MATTVTGPAAHDGDPTPAQLFEAGDIVGLLRACHERRLEREGIPMILGLADERGTIPASTQTAQLDEAATLLDVSERYHEALVPWARDDDEGAVITVMQALAYTHFAPGALLIADTAGQKDD
ncbi:hypothetical protein ARHIZOSPH14_07300 [Agromyces rhizosphaerae]|uniref:Uncharacterized protein n=1 Tax=Agromyces rhizosphaerae TaxID=88374 RepID=A0A9W6CQ64_9MICO|nr:hypothetical protein [Agromyces rhizosphaerae]GLI26488.1 hypothetical protein ARHIZOSPH14_07300 [Agromyces rhizosphaerae]